MYQPFSQYGNMPCSGGFHPYTEYEIGAMKIAEAAHCILGSCTQIIDRLNNGMLLKQACISEKVHIEEELALIEKALGEYSKEIYSDMIYGRGAYTNHPYFLDSQKSIKEVSAKLKVKARKERLSLEVYPEPIGQIITKSYVLIEKLCEALIENFDNDGNAFKSGALRKALAELKVVSLQNQDN